MFAVIIRFEVAEINRCGFKSRFVFLGAAAVPVFIIAFVFSGGWSWGELLCSASSRRADGCCRGQPDGFHPLHCYHHCLYLFIGGWEGCWAYCFPNNGGTYVLISSFTLHLSSWTDFLTFLSVHLFNQSQKTLRRMWQSLPSRRRWTWWGWASVLLKSPMETSRHITCLCMRRSSWLKISASTTSTESPTGWSLS